MGIRSKLIIGLSLLSIITTLLLGNLSYTLSRDNALAEAKNKGHILFDYIQASANFFSKNQYPLIMEIVQDQDRFYPEIMSKFVVSRMEYDLFKESSPGYKFKQATIDPLWPDNKADSDEMEIIEYFKNNPTSEEKEGVMEKDGEQFFFTAKPVRLTNEQCLRCHGKPENAPGDQIEIYGKENGYNWKMGDTVGTSIIYISIAEALAAAKAAAMKIFMVAMGAFFIAILGMGFFINRTIVNPIIQLNACAESISKGENLNAQIIISSKDEIGTLGRSIDRLRISVSKLMSMLQ